MALERPVHRRAPRRRLPLLLLSAVRPPGGAPSSPADRHLPPGAHLRGDRPRAGSRPALPPLAAQGASPPRAGARAPGIGRRVSRSGPGQSFDLRQPGRGTRPPPSGDQRLVLDPGDPPLHLGDRTDPRGAAGPAPDRRRAPWRPVANASAALVAPHAHPPPVDPRPRWILGRQHARPPAVGGAASVPPV